MIRQNPQGLDAWIDALGDAHPPILPDSFDSILDASRQAQDAQSRVVELILLDPALILLTLRTANRHNDRFQTISAAIQTIGLNGALAIALSSRQLDSHTRKPQRHQLMMRLIKSLHSTVQAQGLLAHAGLQHDENTHIALCLLHCAELCFWSDLYQQTERFIQLLNKPDLPPQQIESDLLGTTFNTLSAALLQHWHIEGMAARLLDNKVSLNLSEKVLLIADTIAENAAAGWGSKPVEAAVGYYCELSGLGINKAKGVIIDNADRAREQLSLLAGEELNSMIPE